MATDTVTIHGETHTVSEWLQKIGLSVSGYQKRLKSGMTPEKALTMTKQKPGREHVEPSTTKAPETVRKPKDKQRIRIFVRNGGGAGTWRWIET